MDYFHLTWDKKDIGDVTSLGLAYLGDAVYEMLVRSYLITHGKVTTANLHKNALAYVAAPKQAMMAEKILPILTEEEEGVFRRGRNTKPHSVPKGASRGEYQKATALEALFGYLHLQGNTGRIGELFDLMLEE